MKAIIIPTDRVKDFTIKLDEYNLIEPVFTEFVHILQLDIINTLEKYPDHSEIIADLWKFEIIELPS